MKHTEMVKLMGKVVTVTKTLHRTENRRDLRWYSWENISPWAGWIVGFTYRQDGSISWGGDEEPSLFHETSRQLCVLVASWPTKKAIPVPLDGYKMGGEPEPPDHGGWKRFRKHQLQRECGLG